MRRVIAPHFKKRLKAIPVHAGWLALVLVLAACGGGRTTDVTGSDTGEVGTTPSSVQEATVPRGGDTFKGKFESEEGAFGKVTLEIAAGGERISRLRVHLDFVGFMCGPLVVNGVTFLSPLEKRYVDIHEDGSFAAQLSSLFVLRGEFESATLASGEIRGKWKVGSEYCPWGPSPWSATSG